MLVREWVEAMERIAPSGHAESWDNVGLLVGDPEQTCTRVLLTIDYTATVAREARESGCDAVVAYHPPIFQPLKRIDPRSVVHDALRRGIAIYSPHTALDAPGGTNDVLCDVLGLGEERAPLRLAQTKSSQYKLVTFVPDKDLETVSRAIFDAGAGRIGEYSSCSFRSNGTGTFFGRKGTNPAVGESGRLERAPEVRLETVVPIDRVADVMRTLRQSHPYEEPAFDLDQLAAPPEGVGQGRIGSFPVPTGREPLFARIKHLLEIEHLLLAGPTEGLVKRAAVCAGSCGELLSDAIAQGAELFLTGELRHHDALRAADAGVTVVCTLHSNSERIALKRLKTRLEELLSGVGISDESG